MGTARSRACPRSLPLARLKRGVDSEGPSDISLMLMVIAAVALMMMRVVKWCHLLRAEPGWELGRNSSPRFSRRRLLRPVMPAAAAFALHLQ